LIGPVKENGEQDMLCPLHEDANRSASLNHFSGQWYCFAGCGGGDIGDLVKRKSEWNPPQGHTYISAPRDNAREKITEGMIKGWNAALLDGEQSEYLHGRGLSDQTIEDFEIGWDHHRKVYTIPVRGPDGEIWNVRRYRPNASFRTKIRSITGMRVTELYPIDQLEASRIVLCEGEWDALLTIQHGYPAVTRTSGANTWRAQWDPLFTGKTVYIIQDRDKEGSNGARRIARTLKKVADVRIVDLPYPLEKKHGKDLTDYWLEHDNADFESLLAQTQPPETSDGLPEIVNVLDTFDPGRDGQPVRVQVTIKGRKEPGHRITRTAKLTCTMDAGPKCKQCPMLGAEGEASVEIAPDNPVVLDMVGRTAQQELDLVRREFGALKCPKLDIEVSDRQAVELLFARPSVDHSDGTKASSYKNITITSAGRHDTEAGLTVVVTGAGHPSPRDNRNEFLAWDIQQQKTSVDHFEVTPKAQDLMRVFQTTPGQSPFKKLGEIERELAAHVTRIVGRPEMHAIMDLTYHSLLSFKFGGQLVHRGWIESLVVGDTRTGKSEAAERLIRHFGAGEIVGGEAATLAGLVGGLQQIGGRDWSVTWGVIPINDRRLVVIDELSGLQPEEIAKMSDVRASGMARLTKIQQEATFARTRLIWLGNPRNGDMGQFLYGVDALPQLIGNPEDIARFDIAMAVTNQDVRSEDINRRAIHGNLRYTSEACHTLLMWVWTRQPDQIVWIEGAEDLVYQLAIEMGGRYTEDPPLVQAANVRIKIARLAGALAARTFSTDDEAERVLIREDHVKDAVRFFDHIYGMPAFGYQQRSHLRIADVTEAGRNIDNARAYLATRPVLVQMLLESVRFRGQDLEGILGVDRTMANSIAHTLYNQKMLRKEGPYFVVEPILQGILRDMEGSRNGQR
jgi:hypothetical protein